MATYKNFKTEEHNKDFYNVHENGSYKAVKKEAKFVSTFDKVKEDGRKYAGLWKWCPDLFIDFITPKGSYFKLFFYQRIFLRTAMRSKYFFATFTRAFSKSFLSILILYLKLIFFPGIKLFICSGAKQQAANIAKEKIEELWELFPLLKSEVRKYEFTKDYVRIILHNNSKLDIVAVSGTTRGGRRNGGLVEEVIEVNGDTLSEVILPLMNVDRRAACGGVDPNEMHKSQLYVTTSSDKSNFAYNKMRQFLVWMAYRDDVFVMGGSWRIPVFYGLLDENFIEDLKDDGTYNPYSFDREYESIWTGVGEGGVYSEDIINKNRVIKEAEFIPNYKLDKNNKNYQIHYILSVDVARAESNQNANTIIEVMKVKQNIVTGKCVTSVVNVICMHGEHFEEQVIRIKRLANTYEVKMVVCDVNGLGKGIQDYFVKENIAENGEVFPPYEVVNNPEFDKYKTDDSIPLLYGISTQGKLASDIHVNCLSQLSSGKVKLLIDDMEAKIKANKKDLHGSELGEYLSPFKNTSQLKDEMLNLKESHVATGIRLDRMNKSIQKDRYSALEYGLWYIKTELEDPFEKDEEDEKEYVFY